MDRNWSYRSPMYKLCFSWLMIGFCPFIIGFGAPKWLALQQRDINGTVTNRSFGLWEWCDDDSCFRNPSVGNEIVEDWFLAVVILQTISLLVYLIAAALIITQNFAHRRWIRTLRVQKLRDHLHRDSETPEDFGFVSGFLSLSGTILFMLMTADTVSQDGVYSWGFGMAFIGATSQVTTGVLMCKYHTPPPMAPPIQDHPMVVHTLNPEGQGRGRNRGQTESRARAQGAESQVRSQQAAALPRDQIEGWVRSQQAEASNRGSGQTDRYRRRQTERSL